MATQKIRKCSVCRAPGHNRKTCTERGKRSVQQTSTPSTRKRPTVVVRVRDDVDASPHVVDLRRNEQKKKWDGVELFAEKDKTVTERREVDLAHTVRVSRAATQRHWKRTMERVSDHVHKTKKNMVRSPLFSTQSRVSHLFGTQRKPKEKILPAQPQATRTKQTTPIITFSFRRVVLAAVTLLVIVAAPFPAVGYYHKLKDVNGVVVRESTNGFLALQASTVAALQSNIGQAQTDLTSALNSFSTANSLIEKEYHLLTSVAKLLPIVGTQVSSRQNLLLAGHHLALGNTYLVKGIGDAQASDEKALTERFSMIARHLQSAIPQYDQALHELGGVDSSALPVEYQASFDEFKLLFATFIDDMKDLVDLVDVINTIFGDDSFKRYLVIFQNHHELRPTGGFMGSFAVLDVQKGKILNIDVPGGGTYDLKGQLTEYVEPPLPLQLLNKRWEFQDANWFPDFAASAEKMEWFYQHSRGRTVDGVIAINASVLERMLSVLGPIENEEYELVLDHENVLQDLQYEVEIAYDKEENTPKEAIAVLLEQLLTILKDTKTQDIARLLGQIHEAAQYKEVQLYMDDREVQESLREFGWTGEIVPTKEQQDYLMVVHTNIQGQKSDAKIEQSVDHQAHVQDDGSIIGTVTITRTHTGTPGEQFYGSQNISFVRAYVPRGSELLDAGGFVFPPEDAFKVPDSWYTTDQHLGAFEHVVGTHLGSGTRITTEFDKTAFGNWVVTAPGQTSEVHFTYKLPFKLQTQESLATNPQKWQALLAPETKKLTSRYSVVTQKQSGTNSTMQTRIIYPDEWVPVWRSHDRVDLASNGAIYDRVLKGDDVVGIVMQKNLPTP